MSEEAAESGTRARTRAAILDAALSVWGDDPTASLGRIAATARVGRTTLHRYFPERADLEDAAGIEIARRVDAAAKRARLDEGLGAEALRRLCQEYFELADVLAVMFNGAEVVDDDTWARAGCTATPLQAVVERGHQDGSLDDQLSPGWVESLLWSLLYAGWSLSRSGGSKVEVLAQVTRSFEGAIATRH